MAKAESRKYETYYILRPTISDSEADTIHQKVDSVIGKFKGKVEQRDNWGSRNLAYAINDFKTGQVSVINYSGESGVVLEMERHFRISDDVIRFNTISLDEEYDYKKVKKQIKTAEEEAKKAREARRRH